CQRSNASWSVRVGASPGAVDWPRAAMGDKNKVESTRSGNNLMIFFTLPYPFSWRATAFASDYPSFDLQLFLLATIPASFRLALSFRSHSKNPSCEAFLCPVAGYPCWQQSRPSRPPRPEAMLAQPRVS